MTTDKARLSFELDEEMLSIIEKEFNIEETVKKFAREISGKSAEEIKQIGEEFFTEYGKLLIRRSLQLGEEYTDRTYEVLREGIDATGGHMWFPLLPQRFLEIAYLSTQNIELLPVYENNPHRLAYGLDDCKMFKAIKEQCGEDVANLMTCRHACLNACDTLFQDLDYPDVRIEMPHSTATDGHCLFTVTKI